MLLRIEDIHAVEILDSYGRPALAIRVSIADGSAGTARVRCGAEHDAAEFARIAAEAAPALSEDTLAGLADFDDALRKIAAESGSHCGPGAIAGMSVAAARALALHRGEPLWRFLADARPGATATAAAAPGPGPALAPSAGTGFAQGLPVPQFTVVNGGCRGDTGLCFEEFTVVPLGAPSAREAVRAGAEIYERLRTMLVALGLGTRVGADGGFTPEIAWPERVLELMVETITDAGYALGPDGIALGLRVGAYRFRHEDRYRVGDEWLDSGDMIARYEQMAEDFPVWSVEDGLAPDDWEGWAELTRRLGDRVRIVVGDMFAADPELIAAAVPRRVGNAVVVRPLRLGTVTETLETVRACREAGYTQIVAQRGETNDDFAADLAVAAGCAHIRAGAPIRGERVAQYNRLIEIEDESTLRFGSHAAGPGPAESALRAAANRAAVRVAEGPHGRAHRARRPPPASARRL